MNSKYSILEFNNVFMFYNLNEKIDISSKHLKKEMSKYAYIIKYEDEIEILETIEIDGVNYILAFPIDQIHNLIPYDITNEEYEISSDTDYIYNNLSIDYDILPIKSKNELDSKINPVISALMDEYYHKLREEYDPEVENLVGLLCMAAFKPPEFIAKTIYDLFDTAINMNYIMDDNEEL